MFIAFEYLFNIRFSIENVTIHSNIGQNSLISIVTQCAGTDTESRCQFPVRH